MIRPLGEDRPVVPASAFVHPAAEVIGRVRLGENASVWPGAVLRGDIDPIEIGDNSNLQDNVVCHTDHGGPTVVGRGVTVGHAAVLHSCTVEDDALIGIGAIVLGRAVVRRGALVGAGAVVPPGAEIPAGVLALGSPARAVRPLTEAERDGMRANARNYLAYAARHRAAAQIN